MLHRSEAKRHKIAGLIGVFHIERRYKNGGGGKQETVQRTEPPAYVQPFLEAGLRGFDPDPRSSTPESYGFPAGGLMSSPLTFYPGSTVAPFSPETEAALSGMTQQAMAGAPSVDAARMNLTATGLGGYLNNPALPGVYDAVASEVIPAVQGGYGMAGRTGMSPGAIEAMSRGISRGVAPAALGDYRSGREEMIRAAALAPQAEQAAYMPSGMLSQVGAQRENLAQQQINEEIARHEFTQQEPWQRLMQFIGASYGAPGGSSTSEIRDRPRFGVTDALGLGLGLGGLAYGFGLF